MSVVGTVPRGPSTDYLFFVRTLPARAERKLQCEAFLFLLRPGTDRAAARQFGEFGQFGQPVGTRGFGGSERRPRTGEAEGAMPR
jgi:hypothetical protein